MPGNKKSDIKTHDHSSVAKKVTDVNAAASRTSSTLKFTPILIFGRPERNLMPDVWETQCYDKAHTVVLFAQCQNLILLTPEILDETLKILHKIRNLFSRLLGESWHEAHQIINYSLDKQIDTLIDHDPTLRPKYEPILRKFFPFYTTTTNLSAENRAKLFLACIPESAAIIKLDTTPLGPIHTLRFETSDFGCIAAVNVNKLCLWQKMKNDSEKFTATYKTLSGQPKHMRFIGTQKLELTYYNTDVEIIDIEALTATDEKANAATSTAASSITATSAAGIITSGSAAAPAVVVAAPIAGVAVGSNTTQSTAASTAPKLLPSG